MKTARSKDCEERGPILRHNAPLFTIEVSFFFLFFPLSFGYFPCAIIQGGGIQGPPGQWDMAHLTQFSIASHEIPFGQAA